MVAAAAAGGGAVLAKVRDDAADATVGLGRRLIQRVFGVRGDYRELPEVVRDLVSYPGDGDAVAALRLAVRKALAAEPGLAADVGALLSGAGVTVTASGERSVSAGVISGVAVTGDDAVIQTRAVFLPAAGFPRPDQVSVTAHVSNLPRTPAPVFAGRHEELAAVGQVMAAGENAVVTQVVYGLGGCREV